ncbi:MAG: bifunctional aconitate hydratase 2/2-methylisocitrate dehydratase [Succinivibrio sp.]|nr:bifunctional aconitate hydratase 2/2-methylisocitrate dehydratase [Succinivibrio sp.]
MSDFLREYKSMCEERAALGAAPLPLNKAQCQSLCALLEQPPVQGGESLVTILAEGVPPGVDEAAQVKAQFLSAIAKGQKRSPLLNPEQAVALLGGMRGGYNVGELITLLDGPLSDKAAAALEHTLLIYDAFEEVFARSTQGNEAAAALIRNWAEATWFEALPPLPQSLTLTVFKVAGEINTDDLSPAPDAWSRPDIPLHALAMFKNPRPGLTPDVPGERGPMKLIASLKERGFPLLFVGDVVGTGSSRKSAANSLIWHIGRDIPGVPGKREGGFVAGGKIAPIFFTTLEDAGALGMECPVDELSTGQTVDLRITEGLIADHQSGRELTHFELKNPVLLDELRAGGRIRLIIGKALTNRARAALGLGPSLAFAAPPEVTGEGGFTRAQKIVGRALGVNGVRPGAYCEPKVTTVGSQDTTGPMTRDELTDLACLKFGAPLVMQSFCHTAAYPKAVDIKTQHTLPAFMISRGGVALRPGDGVIHSWLNRMCLPDTVGTGGDSHTRLPLGLSFPAGSGLVAFAAATGNMPLDLPPSVLVRFKGRRRPGITLRDLVHAIPYFAIKEGLLTVPKQNKINVFSGRILEIEGLEDLSVEHAFELSDASAERSAAGCGIRLSQERVARYLRSNIRLLQSLIAQGYQNAAALQRRCDEMQRWLEQPELLQADPDARYEAVLEIDQDQITEPIVCAPNDPDDARLLSEVAGDKVDEAFIGSCMTNIGHYRAAAALLEDVKGEVPVRLWLAPPTRLDRHELTQEGLLAVFARVGARVEIPGCSLCMGNQARVREGATVVSTSTRNFPNRLGLNTRVYLVSAELSAVCARLGRLPSPQEYFKLAQVLEGREQDLYKLLDFAENPALLEL